MRERRKQYENDLAQVEDVLRKGAEQANAIADSTLLAVKKAIGQVF
jgi:hypothetical protein